MTTEKKHLYFVSDAHLGVPDYANSIIRERLLIQFLNEKSVNAKAFYIVGDLFDFWFEYKHAVPKGYFRLFAKLAELIEQGIEIHLFTGNHDMWIFDYLPKEVGLIVHRNPIALEQNKVKMYIAHGDGMGPGDRGYKFIKKVFASKTCQWLFARLHPNFGIGMANYWSRKSRKSTGSSNEKFLGEDKEWLAIYSKEILAKEHIDYFIYGHRHLPMEINLNEHSKYINLGDWIKYFTYAEFDGAKMFLKKYPSNEAFFS